MPRHHGIPFPLALAGVQFPHRIWGSRLIGGHWFRCRHGTRGIIRSRSAGAKAILSCTDHLSRQSRCMPSNSAAGMVDGPNVEVGARSIVSNPATRKGAALEAPDPTFRLSGCGDCAIVEKWVRNSRQRRIQSSMTTPFMERQEAKAQALQIGKGDCCTAYLASDAEDPFRDASPVPDTGWLACRQPCQARNRASPDVGVQAVRRKPVLDRRHRGSLGDPEAGECRIATQAAFRSSCRRGDPTSDRRSRPLVQPLTQTAKERAMFPGPNARDPSAKT